MMEGWLTVLAGGGMAMRSRAVSRVSFLIRWFMMELGDERVGGFRSEGMRYVRLSGGIAGSLGSAWLQLDPGISGTSIGRDLWQHWLWVSG